MFSISLGFFFLRVLCVVFACVVFVLFLSFVFGVGGVVFVLFVVFVLCVCFLSVLGEEEETVGGKRKEEGVVVFFWCVFGVLGFLFGSRYGVLFVFSGCLLFALGFFDVFWVFFGGGFWVGLVCFCKTDQGSSACLRPRWILRVFSVLNRSQALAWCGILHLLAVGSHPDMVLIAGILRWTWWRRQRFFWDGLPARVLCGAPRASAVVSLAGSGSSGWSWTSAPWQQYQKE